MKVALVHDWLVAHRGGEKVLLEFARMFPEAPIYTLVADRSRIHPELASRRIITSFIQGLPGAPVRFRHYLPLFPRAIESFRFDAYDLVLSTSHCVAKGARARGPHVSYIHTPVRYAWDQLDEYLPSGLAGKVLGPAARIATVPLRAWDRRSSGRATVFLANSAHVQRRIATYWGRESTVVFPPVDTDFWGVTGDNKQEERRGYLVVNALVRYKRTDVAVDWATRNAESLVVVGSGPDEAYLRARAGGTVTFMSGISDERLRQLYRSSEALIHPGVEDFGIAPVEAMAAGCPVLARRAGGALETVRNGETGVLFEQPSVLSLQRAAELLSDHWATGVIRPAELRRHAEAFSRRSFYRRMRAVLQGIVPGLEGLEETLT